MPKYRVWFATPIEVMADDELSAEHEAENIVQRNDRSGLNNVISGLTEIYDGEKDKWKKVSE